ncbi:Gfo/Idh/MocA family oxidoreductase [Streptomyces sp. SID8352]|uniref:Gfo/Idh/MocA family oxidoreductase n=1 Tax=Streptomyces sp. SID8352 TaxID=2690338 RepID=UPI00136D23DF|nr:Gfo/Idh/MocA family oxidoreductase [Streptomyces sp. SID8352]MYU20743.1 Gfo/Idh/MocA family oxidoreductase [Streptomyces sp. SID8352]
MRQPLIIGLGRSGSGLHVRALRTARAAAPDLWDGPIVAVDPRPGAGGPGADGVARTRTLDQARPLLTPDTTVAHVCTPPDTRPAVIADLAARGFRDLVVEKPLAADAAQLAAVERLREHHDLRITVVAPWPAGELARRLRRLIATGQHGRLLRIEAAQHKPRFQCSLRPGDGHPTAFEVEMPHSLGLVLDLAGPATVTGARLTDLRCGETVRPHMGSARIDLRHTSGVHTRIVSDLAAPVRERSVTLFLEHGTVVAHFPLAADDDHAQLITGERRDVFRDDALAAFMTRAYDRYATVAPHHPSWKSGFDLHADVVRLLDTAKTRCGAHRGEEEAPRAAV